jgi:hypothetical protein
MSVGNMELFFCRIDRTFRNLFDIGVVMINDDGFIMINYRGIIING